MDESARRKPPSLREILWSEMKARQWNYEDLARECGLPMLTITDILFRKIPIDYQIAKGIADAINGTPDAVLKCDLECQHLWANRGLRYKGYVGKVEWDPEMRTWYGRVVGMRDIITFQSPHQKRIKREFIQSIRDYTSFCDARGEKPEGPWVIKKEEPNA